MTLIVETENTAQSVQQYSVPIEFIERHYRHGDLLCFAFQSAETSKWIQVFRTFEEAIKPETMASMQKANDAGHNIYVAMNVYKGPRRTEDNIAAIRNLWAELDANGRENLNKIFDSKLVLEPTTVNESSPNKFHAIWAVDGVPVEQAKALLKLICAEFNGDSNAIDAARVLRLPGFKNHKYPEKPEVEVVHMASRTARLTAIDFQLVSKQSSTVSKSTQPTGDSGPIPEGFRDTWLASQAGKYRADGDEYDAIYAKLQIDNGKCLPPKGDADLKRIARSYSNYQKGTPITVTIGGRMPGQGAAHSFAAPEVFEWSEVEPLDDQLRPVAPFKPEFLPDSIRPWVVDVSERMSVPLDFTGICALITIAGVIGRRGFVCPKAKDKEWRESVALSGAVVAESGKTKTPTWKTFTNIVVEKEADWQEDHKKKAAKYAEDSRAWEALDKKNKEAEKKTGVVQNTPPAPEEPTPSRRLLLNDATPEKMHDVMKSNPCGLFYLRDELSSWVAEFDKEGREVQRGMFLAAMNGNDPYTVDRIGRDGGAAIMCVSVFGGFQPDMFRDFLNNTNNVSDGTIPRFPLLVWPDESDLPIVDRPANDSAKQQFRRVIRELAEMNEKQILIHFSPEAQPVFDNWLVSLSRKIQTEENSGKRSHLSKYKGALPKIAALLQIVDLVSNGPLAGTHVIDLAHLNKAIDLLTYLETHMHRIYGCIQTPIQKAESAIAKRLRNGDLDSGFTIRAIQRKHWRDLSRPEYIDLALETLVEKGWLRDLPKSEGRGRPTTAWEINPALIRG
jgi:Protein of unknown function (DUF3987)/RepB DNA-primase from phage plasmid/Primase C terminal 1 (PriCT-1)